MWLLEWGREVRNHSVPTPGWPQRTQHWVSGEKGMRAVRSGERPLPDGLCPRLPLSSGGSGLRKPQDLESLQPPGYR